MLTMLTPEHAIGPNKWVRLQNDPWPELKLNNGDEVFEMDTGWHYVYDQEHANWIPYDISSPGTPLLSEIYFSSNPTILRYYKKSAIDLTGAVVKSVLTDGTEDTVSPTYSPASGDLTPDELGEHTITATFTSSNGITKKCSVNYMVYELSSIYISEMPTKTVYEEYTNLDLTGVVVKAVYSDGEEADVTASCVFNPADGTELDEDGTVTVSASYTEDGITKTVNLTVVVEDHELDSIDISTLPTKTEYTVGDKLDLTGVAVTAMFTDGQEADVTTSATFDPVDETELTTAGESSVIASYTFEGVTKTDAFDISVAEPVVPDEPDNNGGSE